MAGGNVTKVCLFCGSEDVYYRMMGSDRKAFHACLEHYDMGWNELKKGKLLVVDYIRTLPLDVLRKRFYG